MRGELKDESVSFISAVQYETGSTRTLFYIRGAASLLIIILTNQLFLSFYIRFPIPSNLQPTEPNPVCILRRASQAFLIVVNGRPTGG